LEDEESRENLLSFILAKRKEVQIILKNHENFSNGENDKWNNINRYEFISSQREIL
jgi:hypothetical protein